MTDEETRAGMAKLYAQLRVSAGMSRKALAASLGTTYQKVANRELGRCRVTKENLLALEALVMRQTQRQIQRTLPEVRASDESKAPPVLTY